MCVCHGTSNHEQPHVTNASSFLSPPLLRRQGYFITFDDVYLQLGEQVSKTVVLNDLSPEESE
jgi:hypothetical protein